MSFPTSWILYRFHEKTTYFVHSFLSGLKDIFHFYAHSFQFICRNRVIFNSKNGYVIWMSFGCVSVSLSLTVDVIFSNKSYNIYIYSLSLYIYGEYIWLSYHAWPDGSVGLEHLNQVQWLWIQIPLKPTLSIATSKNPPVVNTIYISSFCYIHSCDYQLKTLIK